MKNFLKFIAGLALFVGLFSIYGYGQTIFGGVGTMTGGTVAAAPAGSTPVGGPGSSTDFALAAWNGTGGNLLRNTTLITDATGKLTFPSGTTSAIGLQFGSDVSFFRGGASGLQIQTANSTAQLQISGASNTSFFGNNGTGTFVSSSGATPITFATNGSTALQLDSTQNATFNGTINSAASTDLDLRSAAGRTWYARTNGSTVAMSIDSTQGVTQGANVSGGATTVTRRVKAVSAIANAVATDILTVTVPNSAQSATLIVTLSGSLGAGGAIGANEATGTISYIFSIARTAGVATVTTASTGYGSASSNVAGGATITITAAASAMTGAVGATQTFTVQATISRGSGASTNHTCVVVGEIINANASGVTFI